MSEQGYIYLDRKIRDHWIWDLEPYSKGQAWIDLILSASHKDSKFPFDGKPVIVKRGSFITSIRKLADRWRWSRDKVVAFLDVLEEDGMIKRDSNYRRTLITVKNYCIYQQKSKSKPKKPSTDSSTDSSTNRPLAGHSSDADPAHSSNSEVIRSNDKESATHYDPLAGRRKRYDDL